MIKSINYQANQIASIEISDAEDVQSLGDSWGYGSTARVTGKIESEYMYTPQGWIKTVGGSSGGGVLVVTPIIGYPETLSLDKTWQEIHDADFAIIKGGIESSTHFMFVVDTLIDNNYAVYAVDTTMASKGIQWVPIRFETDSADGYPSRVSYVPLDLG